MGSLRHPGQAGDGQPGPSWEAALWGGLGGGHREPPMFEHITSVRGGGRCGYTHLDGWDQTQVCHQLAGSAEAGHWTPLCLFTICNVRDLRTPSQVVVRAD